MPFRSHTTLKLTKVNTYGLLYEWEGTDASLKPLLLAAHQGAYRKVVYSGDDCWLNIKFVQISDVVPVDPRTVDEWVHPPFSGFFDGGHVRPVLCKLDDNLQKWFQVKEYGDEEALTIRAD